MAYLLLSSLEEGREGGRRRRECCLSHSDPPYPPQKRLPPNIFFFYSEVLLPFSLAARKEKQPPAAAHGFAKKTNNQDYKKMSLGRRWVRQSSSSTCDMSLPGACVCVCETGHFWIKKELELSILLYCSRIRSNVSNMEKLRNILVE